MGGPLSEDEVMGGSVKLSIRIACSIHHLNCSLLLAALLRKISTNVAIFQDEEMQRSDIHLIVARFEN